MLYLKSIEFFGMTASFLPINPLKRWFMGGEEKELAGYTL